ncbi:hypothetical protein ACFQT0_30770 [Hymenobacter humi]|uniref:PAC domain-containing protein n=1 Tax=Hymenobacter humi TaxID=1411620 RepID=A0ABW2UCS8_9BACT
MRDAQGHVNGVLDFSYDVSEQVQARQQLQQAQPRTGSPRAGAHPGAGRGPRPSRGAAQPPAAPVWAGPGGD